MLRIKNKSRCDKKGKQSIKWKTIKKIPYRRNSSKIQSENRKKEVKSTLLETSIRRFLLFWLGTGTSIKSGEVNLQTYGNITSVFVLHLCNISDILWREILLKHVQLNKVIWIKIFSSVKKNISHSI